jgi:hypothetical protein
MTSIALDGLQRDELLAEKFRCSVEGDGWPSIISLSTTRSPGAAVMPRMPTLCVAGLVES